MKSYLKCVGIAAGVLLTSCLVVVGIPFGLSMATERFGWGVEIGAFGGLFILVCLFLGKLIHDKVI